MEIFRRMYLHLFQTSGWKASFSVRGIKSAKLHLTALSVIYTPHTHRENFSSHLLHHLTSTFYLWSFWSNFHRFRYVCALRQEGVWQDNKWKRVSGPAVHSISGLFTWQQGAHATESCLNARWKYHKHNPEVTTHALSVDYIFYFLKKKPHIRIKHKILWLNK